MTRARLAPYRHEAEVAARFDLLERRFKSRLVRGDVRLEALRLLGPVRGLEVLDLGCGKGRFAAALAEEGARVIGLDRSAAMLAGAAAAAAAACFGRVRGSARRVPLAGEAFDAVIAVEVFEHLPAAAIDEVLGEVRRVLRPGGTLAIVDKNAASWNDRRPWLPNLAVKWIDERRGRWMYPSGGPVRERWFWPEGFARRLARSFSGVAVTHLLSPGEAGQPLFERRPRARRFALWSARRPGGARVEINTPTLPLLPLLLWEPPPGLELILRQEGIPSLRIRDPHPLAFLGGRFVLYDGRKVSAATVRARLSADNVPLDIDWLRRQEPSDPFQALVDASTAPATWRVGHSSSTERVARVPKAAASGGQF